MSSTTTAVARLQDWYRSQCNGEWEHSYGIQIETLDNPGWQVTIDLKGTAWEQLHMPSHTIERSETDWIHSEITDGTFLAAGGAGNLEEMIEQFLSLIRPGAP